MGTMVNTRLLCERLVSALGSVTTGNLGSLRAALDLVSEGSRSGVLTIRGSSGSSKLLHNSLASVPGE